eukprot:COSAG06_NODE_181_length_20926_cov_7.590051_19_plen_132_part_00
MAALKSNIAHFSLGVQGGFRPLAPGFFELTRKDLRWGDGGGGGGGGGDGGDAVYPPVVHPPWDAPSTNQGHACTDGTPSAPSRANARWSFWAAPRGPVPPGGWPIYLEFTSQPSTFLSFLINLMIAMRAGG